MDAREEEREEILTSASRFPNFDIEKFFTDHNIDYKINQSDDHVEYSTNCPECVNHGEPSPDTKKKLWINLSKGYGLCYRCGYAGSIINIVRSITKTSYINAIKIIRGKTVDGLLSFKLYDLDKQFKDAELKSIDLPYGFEPITGPHDYLEKRGIPWQYAAINGWGTCDAGYLKDRIIVPFYIYDRLVFWQARATWESSDKDFKKVLNPKGVSARHVLYNFNTAKDYEEIVLVEGFIDAVKVGPNAMATNGKSLHPEQAMWLLETKAKTITLVWDKDAWLDGRQRKNKIILPSAVRAIKTLRAFKNWEIKYVRELPKKDPGEFRYRSKILNKIISEAKVFK